MKDTTKYLTFIEGKRTYLRPLIESDFSGDYHQWLNDPEVNRFSQRRAFPQSENDCRAFPTYYQNNPGEGMVLAIVITDGDTHIGNIALTNLELVHRSGVLSILLGNKDEWGKGYGAEAIYSLTKHAFQVLNLNRVSAGTFNPAFGRCVEKLGWRKEGVFREQFWAAGSYHDQVNYGILRSDFQSLSDYECVVK